MAELTLSQPQRDRSSLLLLLRIQLLVYGVDWDGLFLVAAALTYSLVCHS